MNKKTLLALSGLLGLVVIIAVIATGTVRNPHRQHEERGNEYLKSRHFKEAIAEFDAAIAIDPKVATPYIGKGMALYRDGKWKDALPLMDKAAQLIQDDDKSEAWWPLYQKGLAQMAGRDWEGAVESFSDSIEFKPNDKNYSARGRAYVRQEKLEQALADVGAARGYNPDSKPLRTMERRVGMWLSTKKQSEAFLKEMAAREGAQKTDSGVIYFELKKGDGKRPAPDEFVKVSYRGTLPDGTEFESAGMNGRPLNALLRKLMPCWVEGLQKMQVGGKARLVCPAETAFGDRGKAPVKPRMAVAYEIELLGVGQEAQ
jgi:FKBP-type peptidyl-prolyl cis-trans isomerase FkpA